MRGSPHLKRGLAITPAKFGISFTATFYNQGSALVLVYRDGSVQVNHGGTEMGQGLFTKIRQIAAGALGVSADRVRLMPTRTDKVPNTSATAASSGTDLNGAAVEDACRQIIARLTTVAAGILECDPSMVRVSAGLVSGGGRSVPFADVCEAAYHARVPLFAQGFYRTPGIHFDPATGQGHPFHYFTYGAAVSEVEVDGFTGAHRLRRVDILQDVGDAISPIVDRGQIEGGFIQGAGWLTVEELLWDARGPPRHGQRVHLQAALVVRGPGAVRGGVPAASDAARRGVRQQGRRRAAADARDLGARGVARRGRRVRRPRRRGRGRSSRSTAPPLRSGCSSPSALTHADRPPPRVGVAPYV